ncbi:MAG: tripartite tricarboxylate transporter substrate binding protein [Betaproteobacteria bacterium]|nr:tripartite tricarboxylate transporter substrate binding protein [Betaproteobacteria bacterium]
MIHASLRPLTLGAALLCAVPSYAQDFPQRTVRIVVQVPPGGLQDTIARATAQELSMLWGHPVIVENRPSAGGVVGAEGVARAAADGHTILQTGGSTIYTNEILRKDLSYDSNRDFAPVTILIASNNILVASPKLPANSLQEIIALARAKPGVLNYGSLGIGHGTHIDAELILREAGIQVTHVPYKGGAQALQSLAGGEIAFAITGITAAIPMVRQGRIKGIGYAGLKRSELFPDMPTVAEAGFPGFESGGWFGWFAPAGTPRATIDRITADVKRVLSVPMFKEKFITAGGHELMATPSAEMGPIMDRQRKAFAAKIKPLNLKLE